MVCSSCGIVSSLRRVHLSSGLVDLAVLVMRYDGHEKERGGAIGHAPSLAFPTCVSLASGSHMQSIVTCSGFLEPGYYAILPLSFGLWHHSPTTTPTQLDEGGMSLPYVVALYSGREVWYQKQALTRPGFMAESIFLLTDGCTKSTVSMTSCLWWCIAWCVCGLMYDTCLW